MLANLLIRHIWMNLLIFMTNLMSCVMGGLPPPQLEGTRCGPEQNELLIASLKILRVYAARE